MELLSSSNLEVEASGQLPALCIGVHPFSAPTQICDGML